MARGPILSVLWVLICSSDVPLVPHENLFPAKEFLERKSYKAR
jgi:hypothetical protein